jgi:hypothetical protein
MKKKFTASEMLDIRKMGCSPGEPSFAKSFPDSDPELIVAIELWHKGRALMEEADELIETLAIAEGWYYSEGEDDKGEL